MSSPPPPPPSSFTDLSSRSVSSSSLSSVLLSSWCPNMDLLAVVTADSHLHLYRLNWNKVVACELEEHDGAEEGECVATALGWRPDGKVLAIGCQCGAVSLLSVESRSIVSSNRPADRQAGGGEGTHAAIMCLRWQESGVMSRTGSRMQARYLQRAGQARRGLRQAEEQQRAVAAAAIATGESGTNDRSALYFDALPSLDNVLEQYQALALPTGVPPPQAAAQQHRSGRHAAAAAAPAASSSSPSSLRSSSLRTILDDSLDFHAPSLLVVGDARGSVYVLSFGTLQLLQAQPVESTTPTYAAVLAVDYCSVSGTISVATRHLRTHTVQLHTLICPPLLTHSNQLLHLTQQAQQVDLLLTYLTSSLDRMQTTWKAARRSFHNKMLGLSDVIDEFASDREERRANAGGHAAIDSEDEADEKTDPSLELLHYLTTGVPSYTLQQFVSRYLSSGPMQKTLDLGAEAIKELVAIIYLALLPAMEQVVMRCEIMRAWSGCKEEFEPLGLEEQEVAALQEKAHALWLQLQHALTTIQRSRSRYTAFGTWILALVRLVNNEHDGSPAPGADATDAEKDGQAIPSYGPFDTGLIQEFIEHELERDVIGEVVGEIKGSRLISKQSKDEDTEDTETALPLPSAYVPPATSHHTSPSIAHAFHQFRTAFSSFVNKPCRALSKRCEKVGVMDAASASSLPLFASTPFTLAASLASTHPAVPHHLPAAHNYLGTTPTLTLRHAVSSHSNVHMAAFLWQPDAAADQDRQFVSVLKYQSVTADDAPSPPPQHLTLLVPSVPHPSYPPCRRQVLSVQFYNDSTLHVLVQYQQHGETTDDLTTTPVAPIPPAAQLSCKLWQMDLSECEAEWWSEVEAEALASTPTLTSFITQQLENGSAPLLSLLPSAEDSEEPLTQVPTRSRLYPSTSAGAVSLNGNRGLAALLLSARGLPSAPKALLRATRHAADATSDSEEFIEAQRALLVQPLYKQTRKLILLDMQEDPEEEEEEEGEAAEGGEEAAAEEEAIEEAAADPDDVVAMDECENTPSKTNSDRHSLGPIHSGSKSSTGSPMLLTLLHSLLLPLLCLLLLTSAPLPVSASAGDRHRGYRYCINLCHSRCTLLDTLVSQQVDPSTQQPFPPGSDPFQVLSHEQLTQWGDWTKVKSGEDAASFPQPNTWWERNIMGWDCPANCNYHCMHATEAARRRRGETEVYKYYGKWPFVRVAGMQELFSSLFSVLNAVPHVYWFVRLRREFGAAASQGDLPMLGLWSAYALVSCNTWLWSTVFHARDFLWTERLDYFCASLGITFSTAIAIIRIFGLHDWKRRLCVLTPLFLLFLSHISYLHFIHFDYGWNMKVSLTVGLTHSALWVGFALRRWSDGYHRWMLMATGGLWLCASLEVFDFPPFLSLLDAHACWHGLTPPISYIFYKWVREDLRFQMQQQQQHRLKKI